MDLQDTPFYIKMDMGHLDGKAGDDDWWLRGPIDDSQKFGKENEKNGYKFWYMKINYYLCKKSRS